MSQQKNYVQITTQTGEPGSPKLMTSPNSSLLLSPKADASKKFKDQQSPDMKKNKLNALKKLYEKCLDEKSKIPHLADPNIVNSKKQELQGYRLILDARKNEAQTNKPNEQLIRNQQSEIQNLTAKLQQKRSQNANSSKSSEGANTIKNCFQQIKQIKQQIKIKQQQKLKNSQDSSNQLEEQKKKLQNVISSLQYKKDLTSKALNGSKHKVDEQKKSIQSVILQIINFQKNKVFDSSNNGNTLQAKKLQLLTKCEQIRRQISINQQKLKQSTKQHLVNPQNESKLSKITALQKEIESLRKKEQTPVKAEHKNNQDTAQLLKNLTKNITNQKNKNKTFNDRVKNLQKQKTEVQSKIDDLKKNKKPKFEEKVPEQVVQTREVNRKLKEQLAKQAYKVTQEKTKSDNLVPPTVIQNFQNRISRITDNNLRYTKFIAENSQLLEQNKSLDVLKEQLEWEINPDIKSNEAAKQKEQTKLQFLQEEVTTTRKKSVQVTNKVQEYAKTYPDFKPEKKVKKPVEPVNNTPKQVPQQGKKNKNKVNKSDSINEVKDQVKQAASKSPSPKKEQQLKKEKEQNQSSQKAGGNKKNKKKK